MTWREEIIGDCRLILGDCRCVLPTLGPVDAVVTDPPYGLDRGRGTLGKRGRAARTTWNDTVEDVRQVYVPAIKAALVLSSGRGAVTPGSVHAFEYPKPADIGGITQPAATGVSSWGRATMQPVLFYGKDPFAGKHLAPITIEQLQPTEAVGHPTSKPERVMRWLIHRASRPGETVLDLFMGSGTTGVACVQLGRKFIGIEIDPGYFDTACRRIEESYRQPRLFAEPEPKPKQTGLFDGEAA